jgi:hypothetical protein
MTWLKTNWRPMGILVLSAVCAGVIHFKPEWRDAVLAVGAILGAVGVHLDPIAYGGSDAKPAP